MWDYLVRILKAEDVPKRPSMPEILHPADEPHGVRSKDDGSGAEFEVLPHAKTEELYCPVCHVRMRPERWHHVEVFLCVECNGAFFSEKALKELAGAIVDLQGDEKEPLIYTPHGLKPGPIEPHRSDHA